MDDGNHTVASLMGSNKSVRRHRGNRGVLAKVQCSSIAGSDVASRRNGPSHAFVAIRQVPVQEILDKRRSPPINNSWASRSAGCPTFTTCAMDKSPRDAAKWLYRCRSPAANRQLPLPHLDRSWKSPGMNLV